MLQHRNATLIAAAPTTATAAAITTTITTNKLNFLPAAKFSCHCNYCLFLVLLFVVVFFHQVLVLFAITFPNVEFALLFAVFNFYFSFTFAETYKAVMHWQKLK